MNRPKSEDYLHGITFKNAQIEYMDFAQAEIKRLTTENKELIEVNESLYNCWLKIHLSIYFKTKPAPDWYNKIKIIAKKALKTNKK